MPGSVPGADGKVEPASPLRGFLSGKKGQCPRCVGEIVKCTSKDTASEGAGPLVTGGLGEDSSAEGSG